MEDEETWAAQLNGIREQLLKNSGYRGAANMFVSRQPIFYDKAQLWWIWNNKRCIWELTDETDILNMITQTLQLYGDVGIKRKAHMLEGLRQVGRLQSPKELPPEWIQFGTTLYNIQTKENIASTPKTFSTCSIPWDITETDDTPTFDKLFEEWVGPKYVKTLYEIIAYCTYREMPIHKIFALEGSGRNGKSQYLKVIHRFLGKENIASTELEKLAKNRFESFKLYKKLVAVMSETSFGILENTAQLKTLTGGDLIDYEAKGKQGFSDYSYTKLILASNSLPTSTDTSEGYYRRWLIIKFPNEFPEGKDIINTIPDKEYEALARKISWLLPELLAKHAFTNEGTITERRKKYIEASNPLSVFLDKYCIITHGDDHIRYNTLYVKYVQWLATRKQRKVTKKEFSRVLEDEGLETRRTTITDDFGKKDNGVFVFGCKWKEQIPDFEKNVDSKQAVEGPDAGNARYERTLTPSPAYKSQVEKSAFVHNVHTDLETPEFKINHLQDVLAYISQNESGVSFETLKQHLPQTVANPDDFLRNALKIYAERGDIAETTEGMWRHNK